MIPRSVEDLYLDGLAAGERDDCTRMDLIAAFGMERFGDPDRDRVGRGVVLARMLNSGEDRDHEVGVIAGNDDKDRPISAGLAGQPHIAFPVYASADRATAVSTCCTLMRYRRISFLA